MTAGIQAWEGWVYLATVIDCYSKKVIAYAMDDNYKTPLITTAIRRAAHNEHLAPGAIFHTDRGQLHLVRVRDSPGGS